MFARIVNTCLGGLIVMATCVGCGEKNIDLSTMHRPDRAAALDAYDVFVGDWTWEAQMLNATDDDKSWTGTASWSWTLDKRCLVGKMSAKSKSTSFSSEGIWSWHPTKKKYIWWMFNDWGYPQQGRATFNENCNCWVMDYKSVGLDGTNSYGRYIVTIKDNDTLNWNMTEWADPFHAYTKMELKGVYKRR